MERVIGMMSIVILVAELERSSRNVQDAKVLEELGKVSVAPVMEQEKLTTLTSEPTINPLSQRFIYKS